MILSEQKQIKAKESRLVVAKGEGGRSGMDGKFGRLVDANCYIWNGWAMWSYCTAQETLCDWVTLL